MKLISIVALLLATHVGTAVAQEPTAPRARRQVQRMDDIIIHGTRQQPGGFYVLQRSALGYTVVDLRANLAREIPRSTTNAAFE